MLGSLEKTVKWIASGARIDQDLKSLSQHPAYETCSASPVLGNARLACQTWAKNTSLWWQHVVRSIALSGRLSSDHRLWHGCP
jgi:hypothetical protein